MPPDLNNLLGSPFDDLSDFFEGIDQKKFRAKQLMSWVYDLGIYDFQLMTNFNNSLRDYLEENCTLSFDQPSTLEQSKDGTCKWLIPKDKSQVIETVYIPEENRGTLCRLDVLLIAHFVLLGIRASIEICQRVRLLVKCWLPNKI